eukprot:COSAG02_NODE_5873_length_3972_cov_20.899045_1_plen_77_part_00
MYPLEPPFDPQAADKDQPEWPFRTIGIRYAVGTSYSAIWRILLIARENSPYAPNGRKFQCTVQSGAGRPMGRWAPN